MWLIRHRNNLIWIRHSLRMIWIMLLVVFKLWTSMVTVTMTWLFHIIAVIIVIIVKGIPSYGVRVLWIVVFSVRFLVFSVRLLVVSMWLLVGWWIVTILHCLPLTTQMVMVAMIYSIWRIVLRMAITMVPFSVIKIVTASTLQNFNLN